MASTRHAERRAMGGARASAAEAATAQRRARTTMVESAQGARGHHLDVDDWGAVEGPAQGVPEQGDLPSLAHALGGRGHLEGRVAVAARRPDGQAATEPRRGVPRRVLLGREKRGDAVGLTKRGKGTKLMVLVSGEGVPLGVQIAAASTSETALATPTLDQLK